MKRRALFAVVLVCLSLSWMINGAQLNGWKPDKSKKAAPKPAVKTFNPLKTVKIVPDKTWRKALPSLLPVVIVPKGDPRARSPQDVPSNPIAPVIDAPSSAPANAPVYSPLPLLKIGTDNEHFLCAIESASIRIAASSGAASVADVSLGNRITVTSTATVSTDGGQTWWLPASMGDKSGYVQQRYFDTCPGANAPNTPRRVLQATSGQTMCTTGNVNIRKTPSTSGQVLFLSSTGEKLTITGSQVVNANNYQWIPVNGRNTNGWAVNAYLTACASNPPASGGSGGYPLFKQCGQSWSPNTLGTCSLTICSAGCAMSSVAMILAKRGLNQNPGTLNAWLRANGGYSQGCLINWSKVDALGKTKCQNFMSGNYNTVCGWISSGWGVVANVNGGGHWVLLTGCDGKGNYNVNDPGFSRSTYPYSGVSRMVVYK